MTLPFKMLTENDIEEMRVRTFATKEPETLAWIESFEDGAVFFDIGANVGIYSLYCAHLHPNSKIYAFEPMRKNFVRLVQNVELNGFANIQCFNVAFDSYTHLDKIFVPNDEVGQSGTQIRACKNEEGGHFTPEAEYLIQHWSFDDFIGGIEAEDYHIKIDVDGRERDILTGMRCELIDKTPQSLLVECNGMDEVLIITNSLLQRGYDIQNEFNKHPDHSRNRRGGVPENIVFMRS